MAVAGVPNAAFGLSRSDISLQGVNKASHFAPEIALTLGSGRLQHIRTSVPSRLC
jgi:hypothetical protein